MWKSRSPLADAHISRVHLVDSDASSHLAQERSIDLMPSRDSNREAQSSLRAAGRVSRQGINLKNPKGKRKRGDCSPLILSHETNGYHALFRLTGRCWPQQGSLGSA